MDEAPDRRIHRLWLIVNIIAWGLSFALLTPQLWQVWSLGPVPFPVVTRSLMGLLLALFVGSLLVRALQNVIKPERRRARIWETVWCIAAAVAVVNTVYAVIRNYPRGW